MKIEDEIKQINEIINKLDIIQDDDWQQKEGETEEGYNARIESMEEELEEELLDYISDSLLVEQEINEEEAIKEALDKIKSDYELFSDAFVENESGKISLKSEEELVSLGYSTPEEIEKLKEIENNINNHEQYINKVKESIKASKDIDSEIDRKMELVKSIISAKKRGEILPSELNSAVEKDKFEKSNEYIANTTTLKRIPIIQNEYISNNYISERRYNNVISSVNNTNTNNRVTTIITQTTTPVVSTAKQKIVIKKIPERKKKAFTNFEKKLDKDNTLTKQKIKARTELKSIFKEYEEKELTKDEINELNAKIENIKKKYPNTVTDKTLDKLYDTFKVKLPTEEVERQPQNIESANDESELNEIQQKLEEELKKIETASKIKPEEIKVEPSTSKIRQKATDVALGALEIGGVIGATIGTIKQKSEEKIEDLKQKGEEVIENIVQQQKNLRRKRTTKSKKETTKKADKSETPQVIPTPIKTEPSNNEENKTEKKEENTQTGVTPKTVSKNPKISRKELIKSLKKAEEYDTKDTHAKGINLLVINKLICYLKDNDNSEIQERLNKEIVKLQSDKLNGELYIYNYQFTYPQTLKYMYESYRDGVKSTDGSRNIIQANPNAASYYLYLTYNNIQRFSERKNKAQQNLNNHIKNGYIGFVEGDKQILKGLEEIEKGWNLESGFIKEIHEDFNADKEDTCYRYFEFLKEKYKIDELKGIERLKTEPSFINELQHGKYMPCNTEYLNLAIYKELLSRQIDVSDESKFKGKIRAFETKINNGEKINPKSLKLLGDIYYKGLKNASDEDVVFQNKRKATKVYEQIINEKGINADTETYSNLINIYSDNTIPLYDKTKADKLLEIATKKGLHIERRLTNKSNEPYTYACSDLHGEYPTYKAIINQLKENDKLYVLGDVIDRGEDGIKILQDVMKRKEQGQVEFLIGNHELMMIQSLFLGDEKEKQIWTSERNGGNITLKSFEKLNSTEQSQIRELLLDSYVYKNINVDSQNVHLVHAKSIQDKNDNSNKTVREMLAEGKEELMSDAVWERGTDGSSHPESAKPGTFTVIGHTPTDKNMIEYKNGYIDIDCGVGKSIFDTYRRASLVNLTNGTVKYFDVNRERKKENNKQNER